MPPRAADGGQLAHMRQLWSSVENRHQVSTEPICLSDSVYKSGARNSCRVGPAAIIAFIAFLIGALLGQRFNVLSLLPTTMIALPCAAGVGATGGARLVSVLLAMLLVWAALQLGYFAGICAQASWTSLRDKPVP